MYFFDNYFSSPELLALSKRKIHATSTLQVDRTRNCTRMSRKALLKKGRVSYDFRLEKESGVLVCKWFDNSGSDGFQHTWCQANVQGAAV